MSDFRIDQITNQAGTAGPQIAGITTFSSTSGLLMPSGPTEYRGGRGRGVIGGGLNPAYFNVIQYITISTLGNAQDFGDLYQIVGSGGACASSTRGFFTGGSEPANSNVIQYITISSTGNSFDFGDTTLRRTYCPSVSDTTRGVTGGGITGPTRVNVIDYFTMSSLGNSSDFGDLTVNRRRASSASSPTRGIWYGGENGIITVNTIDYITISTTGDAIDFGDIATSDSLTDTADAASNSTRMIIGGGNFANTISYLTIASTGNSTDFGDLTQARGALGACSTPTRVVFAGGYLSSPYPAQLTIDYVEIATTGNAQNFGDLNEVQRSCPGLSDAHGGLGD